MTIFDKKAIKDILSSRDLVVGDIELDSDRNIAEVFIEVNTVGIYSPTEIDTIVKKISGLESLMKKQGFIHEIKFGDIYKGSWRILIVFLSEEEIEEWEKNMVENDKVENDNK